MAGIAAAGIMSIDDIGHDYTLLRPLLLHRKQKQPPPSKI
jgi:hypothetical protein